MLGIRRKLRRPDDLQPEMWAERRRQRQAEGGAPDRRHWAGATSSLGDRSRQGAPTANS